MDIPKVITHSSLDRYLVENLDGHSRDDGHFHHSVTVNSGAMNIFAHIFEYLILITWDICQGMKFMDHMLILCLNFEKMLNSFPQLTCRFTFPLAIYEGYIY